MIIAKNNSKVLNPIQNILIYNLHKKYYLRELYDRYFIDVDMDVDIYYNNTDVDMT
jgi:hypothetical protein